MELSETENAIFEKKVARAVPVILAVSLIAGVALLALHSKEIGIALIVASVLSAAARPWRLSPASLWASSAIFFAMFLGVIIESALASNARRGTAPELGNQLLDNAQVDSYLASAHVASSNRRVRTGVFLTHLEFQSSNNVQVAGYVWQIYPPGTPKELQKGVVFPEAQNGGYGDNDIQAAYDVTRDDGTEIMGWHFNVTLRQRFDYAKYPFDEQDVWLRMWHRDFERGAILVPDFDGYPPWTPRSNLGLEHQFVYSGWAPTFTSYGYLENTYEAEFGFGPYKPGPPLPELVYTVSMRRLSAGPLVNHLMPLIVTYLLTFAILMFMVKDDERSFNILSALAGLFFLTLLNHQQINSVAQADTLSFLGVASSVLYVSFFLVAANAFAVSRFALAFLEWRTNLIAKLLFLPATSLVMAIVSVKILKA